MMNSDEVPGIDPEELRNLKRELRSPSHLEDQVVQTLRSRGAFGSKPSVMAEHPWLWAAAAVLLIAIGFGAGRMTQKQPVTAVPNFVFLLHEGAGWQVPTSDSDEAGRVNEYRAWVRNLRDRGRVIDGTKLEDQIRTLAANENQTGSHDAPVAGFFTVRARDLDDAMSIARTCPHLRYGGQIEVRRIQGV